MKTRTLLPLIGLSLLGFTACTLPVEKVPPNTRKVVEPQGTTQRSKSWNTTSKAEGDAALGIFGGMQNR